MSEKIEVRNLTVRGEKKTILANVNLSIKEKQLTAIIGASGCGKSTFLKTLNRIYEEEYKASITGEVLLDGENIYAKGVNKSLLRKRVGMIFQQPVPFPMSIYDNVAYGLRIQRRMRKEKLDWFVEESLIQADLWDEVKDRLSERADTLSGGQKQRLCIARALAVKPEVLLMDEPTSALDPKAVQKIEELLMRLKREITIVLVTHNLEQAEKIADKVVLFPI